MTVEEKASIVSSVIERITDEDDTVALKSLDLVSNSPE